MANSEKNRASASGSGGPDHLARPHSTLPITGDIRTDRALLILASLLTDIATSVRSAPAPIAATPGSVEPESLPRVVERRQAADD
jgi:hypothetical protein